MKPILWEDVGGHSGVKKKQASAARIQRRLEKKRLNKHKKSKQGERDE